VSTDRALNFDFETELTRYSPEDYDPGNPKPSHFTQVRLSPFGDNSTLAKPLFRWSGRTPQRSGAPSRLAQAYLALDLRRTMVSSELCYHSVS